jgi:hypothetical protein
MRVPEEEPPVMDDETRRRTLLRRSFAWDAPLDQSGWPSPPSFWTEEHADEIRRNHGLGDGAPLIPIFEHGATLGEEYRGLDILIVGSPCEPDSLEVLEDIGVPRLTLSSLTPPHERRVLVIWLVRIEHAVTSLRLERRVSLRGEFVHGESVVTDLGQAHTRAGYVDLRKRGLPLLDAAPVLIARGGRRKGWRKGQVLTKRQNLEWYLEWDLDRDPTPEDYAAAIGVKDPETAMTRWRDTGLNFPPTTAQLNELGDD